MIRTLLFLLSLAVAVPSCGQTAADRTLQYYLHEAKTNSPFIRDCRNQGEIAQDELQRLKAAYTHSRLEASGEYLFVPVVSRDGGHTSFKWNAQDGTDYYGYDLGESSGHLHAGITWTQPLLGHHAYRVAREQTALDREIAANRIRMEEHQLERSVTEQYLLCLLDRIEADYTDSVDVILSRQRETVGRLARAGLSRQADLRLIDIERQANEEARAAALQSYRSHLAELNLICGITDTVLVTLTPLTLTPTAGRSDGCSLFAEQYRLDSLGTVMSLRAFSLQYRPQLSVFVNGGLQTSSYSDLYKHFGWAAGLTFSWTLADGRQRQSKERQARWQQSTVSAYRDHAERQRLMRTAQCLSEARGYAGREHQILSQLAGYDTVLADYEKEIRAGQASVVDYITLLKSRVQAERDLQLLRTNSQLAIAAYNYWNW